ncbi:MAG: ABC transporter substrate-binding protein [bacterium]
MNSIKKILKKAINASERILSFFLRIKKKEDVDFSQEQMELDKKLVWSLSKSRIPSPAQLKYIKKYLSTKEKIILSVCFLIIFSSSAFLCTAFYKTHLREVPISGGKYIEGLLGAPKYINPLYSSISDVDSDISGLIYSSLFKRGKDGELVKDLVEEYEISEDGKIYTIVVRRDAKWHNGKNLTAEDVVFTFNTIKNKEFNSPLRGSLLGVNIEKAEGEDDKIKFLLPEAYAPFLELLTFGILPSEIWGQVLPEGARLADYKIGSGPYKIDNIVKDESGKVKEYNLKPNETYYNGVPKIDLTFKFFSSYEEAIAALNNNEINGINYLPKDLLGSIPMIKKYNYQELQFSQLMLIFLNQENNSALKEKKVRQALAFALDRQNIVDNLVNESAELAYGPILPNSFAYYNGALKKYDYNKSEAEKLLDEAGWKIKNITKEDLKKAEGEKEDDKKNTRDEALKILNMGEGAWREKSGEYLTIKLTAIDNIDNEQSANFVKKYWEEVGVKTTIELIAGQSQSGMVNKREFEVLFYGQILGTDPDPYFFWHSTQAGENGFNLAGFKNEEVDELLEQARIAVKIGDRQEKYKKFQEIITEEEPAIFMYSPFYTYIQSKELKGFDVKSITRPSDRFANVNEWYEKTGKKIVWK